MYPIYQFPVQRICEATIGLELTGADSVMDQYRIRITRSPVGRFNGYLNARPMYSPGSDGDYKRGDKVYVICSFIFDTERNTCRDLDTSSEIYIIGKFSPPKLVNHIVENPANPKLPGVTRFINERSKSGLSIDDGGNIVMATAGGTMTSYRIGGYGVDKCSHITKAQNFQNVISNNGPYYLAREHFGLYNGSDIMDEVTRVVPDMNYVIKRSFVTQTQNPINWVSTCEGAYSPYYGANNDDKEVAKNKDVLYTKIVNSGVLRSTYESGEVGDSFVNLRVDQVALGEKYLGIPGMVTPAVLGNLFSAKVGSRGELEITAANKGIPVSNIAGVKISVDILGNLVVQTSGKVSFKHGDTDVVQEITMDPKAGIDINSANGVRINGQEVVSAAFLDWFTKNMPMMFVSAPPGSPAVPNPAALALLTTISNLMYPAPGGASTKGAMIPNAGVILSPDAFSSV